MNELAGIVDAARAVADPLLTSRGFRFLRDVYHHEAFGSRYCEWRRGAEGVRAVWDGKESWLVVVRSTNADAPHPQNWHDLWIVRQEPSENVEHFRRRVDQQIPALSQALTTRYGA